MAFGVEVAYRPDAGPVNPMKGKQKDVACDCWFSSTGETIPRLVKYQDEEGIIRRLEHIRVLEIQKLRRCGIPMVEYKCTAIKDGREYPFWLSFHMEECRWKLAWGR